MMKEIFYGDGKHNDAVKLLQKSMGGHVQLIKNGTYTGTF
jgi:predicted alpha/beta-fold hydrolase